MCQHVFSNSYITILNRSRNDTQGLSVRNRQVQVCLFLGRESVETRNTHIFVVIPTLDGVAFSSFVSLVAPKISPHVELRSPRVLHRKREKGRNGVRIVLLF